MSALEKPVLVLNKGLQPIRVESFQKSLNKVLRGSAKFIDPESFRRYDWDGWVEAFAVPNDLLSLVDYDIIKGVSYSIKAPEVIVCTKYSKMPKCEIKLTRRNLLVRDGFTCQYTGKKVTLKNSTIDHVIPRSRGGQNTWENLVICSLDANIKKANRTPSEAGMVLLKKPVKPKWSPIYSLLNRKRPASWDMFIHTDKWNEVGYWDVELKE